VWAGRRQSFTAKKFLWRIEWPTPMLVTQTEKITHEIDGTSCTTATYPASAPVSGLSLRPKVEGTPCKFAIAVSPKIELFLGCKACPATPLSLTPPLHVQREMMKPQHEFALVIKVHDRKVVDWLAALRNFVIKECEADSSIIGKELTLDALRDIAVKPMGESGQLGIWVPQDGSAYPPQIEMATKSAQGYSLRAGTVSELVHMPPDELQRSKVVPLVHISHLWQDSVYIGVAPRLTRMIVMLPECRNPFSAAGF